MSPEELKINASHFFQFYNGRCGPNVFIGLFNLAERLNQNLEKANESSTKLAQALNRLTLAAVVIAALALIVAVVELFVLSNG